MRLPILVWLQSFQVAFLVLHDWIPVPPVNDVEAVRRENSLNAMVLGTVIGSLFPSIGLAFSLFYLKPGWPGWLYVYLSATYGFLFIGELQAWWIPYLVWPQPKRAARYEAMFGKTWAFLRPRNGIRINALHFILHAATLATLLFLLFHFASGT
jgi:hypothetical protein